MDRASVPKAVTAVFLAAETALYTAFLALDLSGRSGQTVWLKYGGILLCLLYAGLCTLRGGDRLVFPGLLLTAAADWFLLVREDHLTLGVILFLAVQTLYLIRLRRAGAPAAWHLRAGLALLLGLIAALLNAASPLTLLAMLCFAQLLSNAALAWHRRKWLFAAGLTLFAGCDVCVGLCNPGYALPAALSGFAAVGMWLFYLPSQVLIVLSAKERFYEVK